jgi:sugar/nucleoside kinase (ribokinase family)
MKYALETFDSQLDLVKLVEAGESAEVHVTVLEDRSTSQRTSLIERGRVPIKISSTPQFHSTSFLLISYLDALKMTGSVFSDLREQFQRIAVDLSLSTQEDAEKTRDLAFKCDFIFCGFEEWASLQVSFSEVDKINLGGGSLSVCVHSPTRLRIICKDTDLEVDQKAFSGARVTGAGDKFAALAIFKILGGTPFSTACLEANVSIRDGLLSR